MLGEGRRVQVRPGTGGLSGETGIVVGPTPSGGRYDWEVTLDADISIGLPTPFESRELIELGGKHAGLPHPENGPHERHEGLTEWDIRDEIDGAAYYGNHADAQPNYEAERDAYYAGI